MERRDHVLITDLSFAAFRASTFLSRLASAKGPFSMNETFCTLLIILIKLFHRVSYDELVGLFVFLSGSHQEQVCPMVYTS